MYHNIAAKCGWIIKAHKMQVIRILVPNSIAASGSDEQEDDHDDTDEDDTLELSA